MEEKQFCRFCGESIAADAVICPKCGRALRNEPQTVKMQVGDSKSGGFAFLCFLLPVLGLVLYLIWKDDRPLRASSCGKGALVGLICWIVGIIIFWIVIGSFLLGVM